MTLAIARAEAMFKAGHQDVPLQLLVVAPSQELAMQIVRVAQSLLPGESRRTVQQCIGGANPRYQEEALLLNKPLIVVGTPGRVSEFVRIGVLKLHRCPLLVLDEADQLLAPAFAEEMNHITLHCGKSLLLGDAAGGGHDAGPEAGDGAPQPPRGRQTVLVSATLSQTILSKMTRWCVGTAPQLVTSVGAPVLKLPDMSPAIAAAPSTTPTWGWGGYGPDGPAADSAPRVTGSAGGVEGSIGLVPTLPPNLKHYFIVVDPRRKSDELRRCIHALDAQRVLVFMNYQQRLKDLMFKLEARKMKVSSLHGEMSKLARTNVLNDFRKGRLRALVVSDVVARGLDVSECDAVFNSEMPSSAAHYAHRAGRTGRMDAPGTVVSLVTQQEAFVVEKLSKGLGVAIQEAHVANGQLALGPAPAQLRRDDEDDEDGDNKKGGAMQKSSSSITAGNGEKGSVSGRPSAHVKATDELQPGRGSASPAAVEASSSGVGKRDTGNAPSAAQPDRQSAAGRGDVRRTKDESEGPDDEEDDDVEMDVSKLERQVKARRSSASGQAEKGNAKLSAGVRSEVQRELQELSSEKSNARAARRTASKSNGS